MLSNYHRVNHIYEPNYGLTRFLAAQAGERQLDGGPLDQLFSSARERAASVRAHPRDFVACGAAALEEVGRVLQPKLPEVKNPAPPASPAGYSLTELKSLAKAYSLDMVPVRWPRGEALPVPCVIHWPGDHFGAVLSRREGWYQIADATFEAPRWVEAQTLQAETTGFVLVPATNAPAPWQVLPPAVTDTVFGKDLSYCYLPDSNDELLGKGRCPAHMMSWQVTEPFLNVWLSDSPLAYQPALGPRVAVEIYYKQRNQNSRNPRMFDIGGTGATNSNWTLNWQTYLEVIDQGGTYDSFNATLHVGDGGLRTYYVSNDGNPYNDHVFDYGSNTRLERLPDATSTLAGFRLTYPNGREDYYTNLVDFSSGTKWAFRATEGDGHGHCNRYTYTNAGDVVRLTAVVDADGHATAVNYYNAATNLIKEIVDLFNRTNRFGHTPGGCLTNITDMGGLSVAVAYNSLGWVTNLTTPYGATAFFHVGGLDTSIVNDNNVNRAVIVTEPTGDRQMYLFRGLSSQLNANAGSPPLIPYSFSDLPQNTPLGTLDNAELYCRNSFHWDTHQYAHLSADFRNSLNFSLMTTNDYLKARLHHWLKAAADNTVSETLSFVRDPSPDGTTPGQKTWLDYAYKPASNYQGANAVPGVVAQILPDSTTGYSYNSLNPWCLPYLSTSTYSSGATVGTRSLTRIYANNNLDLLEVLDHNTSVVAAYGVDTTYHLVTALTNALGVTRYTYDPAQRLTSIVQPSGLLVTNLYFNTAADSNRLQTTILYDAPGGAPLATNTYTYWPNGLVYAHTDPRDLTTLSSWDDFGRLTAVTYPAVSYRSNVYTRLDLTATRDRLGNWTYYGYDNLRRQTSVTNSRGHVTLTSYCGCGSPESVSNAFGVTTMIYDNAGRLVTHIDPATNVLHYAYSATGQLTNLTDALGHSTTNVYNNQGLLIAVKGPGGLLQSNVFDIDDHVSSATDAEGVVTTMTYDLLDRLTNMVDAAGVTSYAYGSAGTFLTEDGPWADDAMTISYTNTVRARLSLLQPSAAAWTNAYGYDTNSRLASLVSPAGVFTNGYLAGSASSRPRRLGFPGGISVINFNRMGQVAATMMIPASGTTLDSQGYGYDTAGQRTNMNGIAYAYDAVGQLTSASGSEDGGLRPHEQWAYQYDRSGNLAQRVKNQLTETFTADANNQLTGASRGGTLTVAGTAASATQVSVNGQGALLYSDKTWAVTGVPLTTTSLTAVATHTITLNPATALSPQYDQNGNLLSDGRRSFTYDTENQLVSVLVTNGPLDATLSGFVYDGLSRRRIRTEAVWRPTGWVTNEVVRYLYDGNRVIQERDGSNTVLVTYTRGLDLSGTLEGAGGIGGFLARTHPGNHHFYYHSDANGNVTAIINQSTNLVAQYRYDPFGNLVAQTGPLAEGNLYRFSSKEFHQASGLYYYGYRFYDPNLQRWLNRDPSGTKDGPNLHAFCHNRPVKAVDAWGLALLTTYQPTADRYGCIVMSPAELQRILEGAGIEEAVKHQIDWSISQKY